MIRTDSELMSVASRSPAQIHENRTTSTADHSISIIEEYSQLINFKIVVFVLPSTLVPACSVWCSGFAGEISNTQIACSLEAFTLKFNKNIIEQTSSRWEQLKAPFKPLNMNGSGVWLFIIIKPYTCVRAEHNLVSYCNNHRLAKKFFKNLPNKMRCII